MTGSVILDVIIGLVFIFLLYSLLATIIQEMIATKFSFRAKVLEKAITRMLQDGNTTSKDYIIQDRLNSFWHLFTRKNMLKEKQIASWFYAHPLVKYLGEDNCYSKPGYLSPQNFSKVMLDLLHGIDGNELNMLKVKEAISEGKIQMLKLNMKDRNNPAMKALFKLDETTKQLTLPDSRESDNTVSIDPETKLFLQSLWSQANGELEQFKTVLEQWFDDTMNRATGWYKRYNRVILFYIGLIIAISFNVDTLAIAKKLVKDPELRAQLLQQTESYMAANKELSVYKKEANPDKIVINSYEQLLVQQKELIDTARSMLKNDIGSMNALLGLGYGHYEKKKFLGFLNVPKVPFKNMVGLLLTAFAISLGAPFWFDLLNKLMKLRNSYKTTGEKVSGENTAQQMHAAKTISANNNTSNTGEEAVG